MESIDRADRVGQSETVDELVREAIAGRRLLQLRYDGKDRVVEPHDYGEQKGSVKLLVYQLRASGGTPGKGAPGKGTRGWRLLEVSKIAACRILDDTFAGSRGHEHQQHYAWNVLYLRVD